MIWWCHKLDTKFCIIDKRKNRQISTFFLSNYRNPLKEKKKFGRKGELLSWLRNKNKLLSGVFDRKMLRNKFKRGSLKSFLIFYSNQKFYMKTLLEYIASNRWCRYKHFDNEYPLNQNIRQSTINSKQQESMCK